MILIVRQGAIEFLKKLSEFCTLYVYSHGLKEYIEKILEVLDPNQELFQEREHRVLAPRDPSEQIHFKKIGKNL